MRIHITALVCFAASPAQPAFGRNYAAKPIRRLVPVRARRHAGGRIGGARNAALVKSAGLKAE